MRTKLVNRYYCDFCRKSGGSAGHMKRHETHCTMNPSRECRVCKLVSRETTRPIAELIALLPNESDLPTGDIGSEDGHGYYHEPIDNGLKELREATFGCPACMLAAIRQSGLDASFFHDFDFKKEMAELWKAIEEERASANEYYNVY